MIEWLNHNEGFAMALLTAVYVIATIFICLQNSESQKITKEQIDEMRRQFKEENRAYLILTLNKLKNGLITLCIENIGKKIAQNVKLTINEDFINNLKDEQAKQCVTNLTKANFDVGVGQKWHVFLDTHINLAKIATIPMMINISYKDNISCYKEERILDLGQYNWALLNDSEISDIRGYLKSQSDSIKSINKNIYTIANIMQDNDKNDKN